MTQYERFQKSTQSISPKDVARWLYVASACRLWLRESRALRRARRRPVSSRWDWSSTGAPVMR